MSLGTGESDRPDGAPAGRRWRPPPMPTLFSRSSSGGVRMFAALVWLAFIVFPLIDAIGKRGPVVRHGLAIGGAAVFVAAYVSMVMTWRGRLIRSVVPRSEDGTSAAGRADGVGAAGACAGAAG